MTTTRAPAPPRPRPRPQPSRAPRRSRSRSSILAATSRSRAVSLRRVRGAVGTGQAGAGHDDGGVRGSRARSPRRAFAGGRSSRWRAGRASRARARPAPTRSCSAGCSSAGSWCWSTCEARGLSDPIICPDAQRGRAPEWIAASECARRLGPRFESYRTSAAADDVNDVRDALGYDEITLYGDSYGTFWAQSYAFRHGETLNALVLDSAYPARGESPRYGSLTRPGCARSRWRASA
jgi:hypothetical protein